VKVFLDTNVLVSAFAARGLCADLYESMMLGHELITGRNVLRELAVALHEKIKLDRERCDERVRLVSDQAAQIVELPNQVECDADADDLLVLGEAVAGAAEIFVTGDAELLKLKRIGAMRIVTPRQFWETLKSEQGK